MKISISNIAWDKSKDEEMYKFLNEIGFDGLEIAPTRIFEESPYEKLNDIEKYSNLLHEKYNLNISSMQSIWYGKKEKIFGTEEERKELISYTKKAIDFAKRANCNNLVFGCPKNRIIDTIDKYYLGINFFKEIGQYAAENNIVVAIEPNPSIYNTNYINRTNEAFKIVKEIDSEGIKVNIDLGTIIENHEDIEILKDNMGLINHVHISEPNLNKIMFNGLHERLIKLLNECKYKNYVSIEMKNLNDIENVKSIAKQLKKLTNK
ncbi:sugar phosphate isomerase/epimerase family protein [Clostridium neonatale]|uniref:Endonuclease n=1 Tax=Clostridium neonatale TaxID=137838 RepID=A0AA86JJ57_9CLOT|nr:sugar phosphate isomerase/epimerase family protein [Clostridium neonatale]MBP8313883.1 sugar phosphate isomerase/epimerase [Clostridium neonatale]CAG9704375.1 Endonuclease [Clostridium neonatale]CAI3559366.1 Endonuclease [Clostridium neonatale]CAI3562211.1 Endonuclease [Clostridium neonatale]CAI3587377.1 Endonuclease [Clostridium neonatale]